LNFTGKFDSILSSTHPKTYIDVGLIQHGSGDHPDKIIVSDAQLLFMGDYRRSGVDLILSKDGHELVVEDYFRGEKRASLASPDGSHLTGDIVNALAGNVEYAQAAGGPDPGRVIGHVTKLTGNATAIRNGVSIILNAGDNVEKGDVVQTGTDSQLGLTFIDGTVFGLSSNARMVLNEMVYDSNGSSNSSLLSLVAGTISFVAGETAKHGDMKVDTPTAVLGIRGTAVLVEIDFTVPGQGNTPAVNFQVLAEPDGHTGSYTLYSKPTDGSQPVVIGQVNQSGLSYTITANNQLASTNAPALSPQAAAIVIETFIAKFNAPPPTPPAPDNNTPNNANPNSAPSGGGGSSTPPPPATPLDTSPIGNTPTATQPPAPTPINNTTTPPSNTVTPPPTITVAAGGTVTTITVTPAENTPSFTIAQHVTTPSTPPPTFVAFVPGSATVTSVTTPASVPTGVDLTKLITVDETTGAVNYNPASFAFLKAGQAAIVAIGFQSSDGVHTLPETLTLTIDGAPPVPPTVAISNHDVITNAPTQTISGTVAAGLAAPGDTVTLFDTVNGVTKQVGTATVGSDGTWATTVTLSGDGTHSIVARDTDAVGNVGASPPVMVTLDTVPPTVTITTAAETSNVASQTISGTVTAGEAAAGTTVTLFDTVNGVTSQIGTATVGSDGKWTTNVTLSGEAAHTIVALDEDVAGNIGVSTPVVFTLSATLPPTVTIDTQAVTTNAAAQLISGTVTAGEAAVGDTVTLFDTVNGATTQLGTATVGDGGGWSTSVTLSGDGTHSIVAQDIDIDGNLGASAPAVFTLDTVPPTVTIATAGTTSNVASHTLSGTVVVGEAAVGTTVTLLDTVNGVTSQLGTATVGPDGKWTTAVTLSGDGAHSIVAEDTDAAGNIGSSSAVVFTLDTIAPTVTIGTAGATTNQATHIISGGVTAGEASIGTTVTLLDNGDAIGSATVGDDGTWSTSLTLSGDGAHSIVAEETDTVGNVGISGPVVFTLDTLPPTVTISTAGTTTNQSTQTISGTVTATEAAAGNTVTLFDTINGETTRIGTATVRGGAWSTNVTLSGNGTHGIVAEDTDAAGNTGSSSAAIFTLAAVAPTIAITSPIADDNTINKSEAAAGITISGTAVPGVGGTVVDGQTATITIIDGSNVVKDTYTATVSGGAWSVNVTPAQAHALADGSYLVKADVSDAVGNVATTATQATTVDETTPTGGTPDLAAASDSSTSSTDNITNVTAPSFVVALGSTVAAGDMVQLLLGGSALAHPVTHIITATDVSGGSVTLAVTAGDLGADGTKSISAQFGDAAGNASTTSALSITLDTTAPTGGTPDLIAASDSGTSSTDNITNVTAPSFAMALGSTVAAGDTVQLLLGGAALAHPVTHIITTADLAAGTVTLAVTAGDLGADGTKPIAAQFSDAAGNTSTSSALSITLDTTAPAGGTPDLVAASDSGTSSTDNITNVTAPGFVVAFGSTVVAGDTVQLLFGGSAFAHPVTHTITAADVSAGSVALAVTTGDLGADGTKSITAQFSDAAGNNSTTSALSIALDTAPPTVTISTSGTATNQATQAISGTVTATEAAAGNTVTLFDTINGATTQIGTATVSGGGWSTNVTLSGNGTHSIIAEDTDAAGNTGSSNATVFTLATVAPTIAITRPIAGDNTINKSDAAAGITISGTAVPGVGGAVVNGQIATITIVDGSDIVKDTYTATVTGGAWSVNVTATQAQALADGSYSAKANVLDAAGNAATTATQAFTVDETAPTIAITDPSAGHNTIDKAEAAVGVTIIGTATAGIGSTVDGQTATITILDGTNVVKDTYSATVTGGVWSVNVTAEQAQALADGSYTVKANIFDAAGNAANTAIQAFTVDETTPSGGTPDLVATSDSGTSNTDNITSVTAPSFTVALGATVAAGDTVQLLLGGSALAHPVTHTITAADVAAGSVTLAVTAGDLGGDGTKSITAQFSDAAGNTSTSSALSVTLDTTAPTGGTPDPTAASDSGTSSTDNITNVTAPSFTVALGTTAAAGDTVQLLLGNSPLAHPVTHIITAADVTAGSVTLAVTAGDLGADGAKSISAQFSDAAGNTSTSSVLSVTLDTTAPTGGTPDLTAASDSGTSSTDNIADVIAPSFTVALGSTVVVGDTVQLLLGGVAPAHPVTHTITAADVSAGNVILAVTAGDLGADGTKSITAQFTDTAGNTSTSSASSITLDTTAPTGGTPVLTAASDSGTSSADDITNVTAPSFAVALGATVAAADTVQLLLDGSALAHPVTHTITAADVTAGSVTLAVTAGDLGADGTKSITAQFNDAAGNTSTTSALDFTLDTTAPTVAITSTGGPTNQAGQTVTGTVDVADAGATVTVLDGTTFIGSAIVQSNGNWSSNVTLNNGSNSLTAQVTDLAGNTTTSSAVIYPLNTNTPMVTESLAFDTGSSATDHITSNDALSGTGIANTVVHFTIDGTPSSTAVTANTLGAWSFTPSGLADGAHTIVASQTDTFGNTGTASLSFTLDTTAPTGGTPDLAAASDSGTSNTDNITNVTAPSFTIALGSTVVAGDTVQLLLGGAALAHSVAHTLTAFDVSTGTITLSVTAGDLGADGTKSISAQFSDAAGNTSTTSALSITLDTTTPAGGTPVLTAVSDSGTSNTDDLTNVTAPSFTVALDHNTAVGDTVQLLLASAPPTHPVTHTITAADVTAGSVTLALTAGDFGVDGTKSITAQFRDAAGNLSTTSVLNVTLDTTPPAVTINGSGGSTNQVTQTISGTVDVADIGTTVTLFDNGSTTPLGTTTVGVGGVWSTSVTLVGDTTHSIVAQDTDAAGNTGTSSAIVFTLNTTAPSGGTPDLIAASDSGTSNTDNITNMTTPTFAIALNATAVTGDTIQLLLGESPLAHPVIHTITAADVTAGSVSLSVTAGDLGSDGSKLIAAQFSDSFGNTTTTTPLTLTLDTTAPTGGTPDLAAASDSGTSSNDNITDVTTPSFTVALNPTVAVGDTVQLFLGGSALAHPVTHIVTAADITAGSVTLTVAGGDLGADGTKSITVQFSDAAGNTSTTPALSITLDTTVPTGGTPDLVATSDSGTSSTDNVTKVTAPSFTVALNPTVVAGDSVQLLLGGVALAHPVTHTVTATEISAGSVTLTVTAGDLGADGTKSITAQFSDTVGNTSTTSALSITLDTTAPTGGTPDLVAALDSGTSSTDNITNITAPSFAVALNPTIAVGDTVQLLLGSAALAHPATHTITATDISAGSVILTVTGGDLGADGAKSITAQFSDTAGNTSTTSALSITLDTTAPTGGTPDLVAATDSGTSNTDDLTDVTAPSFTVALSPTVVAGDSVQLFLGGSALTHPVTHIVTAADITAGSATLTVTAGDLGADGTKSITAQFSDAAGNASTTAALSITLDTTAPTGGTPDLVAASDSGTSNTDNITNVTAPSFAVALNPTVAVGDTVQLLLGGAALAHPVTHTITAADVTAANVVLTVTSGDLGADGAKSITAQFSDAAGDTSTTSALNVTLDTTAPTGGAPDLITASDSGTSSTDNITDVIAPSFTVALNPMVAAGDTVQLLQGGTALAHPVTHIVTAADIAAGSVTLAVTAGDLGADGAKSISAQFSDAAGNTSTTTALSITLDTTVPTGGTPHLVAASDSGTSSTDNITNVTAPSVSVALNPTVAVGDTVLLLLGGTALAHPVTHTITATDISAGNVILSVTAGDLGVDGTKSITAQFKDTAGNVSTTTALVITLDTTVPTGGTPDLTAASDSGTSNADNITNVTAPSFTVPLNPTVVAGDIVQLLLAGAAFAPPVTHTVTATDVSTGSVTLSVTSGDLGADGTKPITARFSDAAGNISTSAALNITLDTAPPQVAINTPGGPTAQSTETISGTVTTTEAAPGTTVALFDTFNGVTTQIGAATLTGSAWSTTVTLSGSGPHSIVAVDTDAAGNTGNSPPVVYTLTVAANSWANPSGGNWTVGANWSSGAVPASTANVTIGVIPGATAPYSVSILSGTTVLANSLTLSDPLATLVDQGTLSIAASLLLIVGTLEIENGGTLSLGGSSGLATTLNFVGTGGNLVLGNTPGFIGTVNALSTADGAVSITGSGNINAFSGDAIDLTASGGTQANASNLVLSLTGAINGSVTGIDVIQNAVGNIAVTTRGSVTGQTQRGIIAEESTTGVGSVLVGGSANVTGGGTAFSGIVAENLNAANANTVTVGQTGNVTGGSDGIKALTDGTGNVAVTTGAGVTITGTNLYGIEAFSNSTGSISVTTATNDTIFSGSVGINTYNQSTSIAQSAGVTTSTITVAASGAINSGFLPTGSGSLPAGILAGYKGGATTTPNGAVFGDVTVNNSATITAAGGDGIRAYNYGSGNVTVSDLADTTIAANDGYGIEAFSAGSGKISISTDATDIINSGASGLNAVNQATAILATLNSKVSATAGGTINSGTHLNNSGSQPQGISAGYFSNNGTSDVNVNGTVSVDNFANVTAAAGWGIDAYDWGNGNVTLTDEAGTKVSGAQFGIGAYSLSTGTGSSGSVTVIIGNNATISSGSLYGLVGIQTSESNAGNISIATSTGDTINSGGIGIQANNQANLVPSTGQISITSVGTINSGYDINQGGGQPGGIWAGYNPSNQGRVNSSVAGNVIVDNSAVINAPAGAGIGLYNYGTGTVSLTLETTSAITSELAGVNAAAQGGGNVTVANAGSITDASGVGINANIGTSVANGVTGLVTVTNTGTIRALGSAFAPVIQINNGSTQSAKLTNSGTITANLEGKTSGNQAVAVYNGTVTINNTGTISGNVSLNGGTFNNNAGGTWDTNGSDFFGNGVSAIVNAGIINIAGNTFLGTAGTLTLTNSNTVNGVNVAANGDTFISAAVSGIGTFTVGDRAELEFANSVAGQTISFAGTNGLLVLDNPASFTGGIFTGLAAGDAIELQGIGISSATVNGSTLTIQAVQGANNITLNYGVSFNATVTTFDILSGNEIVFVPASPSTPLTPITGAVGAQVFSASGSQFYQLKNATVNTNGAVGLNIGSQDTVSHVLTVEIDQPSSVSTTGAFNAINVTSTVDNIELINASFVNSAGGSGIFVNSGTGSADVIDTGSVSAGQAAISVRASGPGTLNIAVSNGATIASTSNSGIVGIATSSGNIDVSTTQGAKVNSATSGIFAENQGISVGSAGAPSNILVSASGTINSGNAPGTGEPAGILAGFLGGTSAPANPPNAAVFGNVTVNNNANITANTGIGINAFNDGVGDITVSDGSNTTIQAAAALTTAPGFAQYGIDAFNFGPGSTTVTTDFNSIINSGASGIFAQNQYSPGSPATAGAITVIANGSTINSGANSNNGGGAPAGIEAGFNPGNGNQLSFNLTGNVLVEDNSSITASVGDGINAFNYSQGNVEVDLSFNATITALNSASSGSTAPFGINAFAKGSGDITVNMSNGDNIHSGSIGVSASNQDTSIPVTANSMIVVTAAGTIISGTILTNNSSQPSGISAGYLGANTGGNTSINGTVIVDNNATITASAGSAINAYNFGNGNVTVNDAAGTTISGAQYGISAYTESGGTGNLAINVGANATITATNAATPSSTTSAYGILAFSTDAWNISVITSSGDTISGSSTGINAVNEATVIDPSVNSSIVVTANGSISSGTGQTGTGSPPAGITAGYLGGAAIPESFPLTGLYGDVTVNNFATINAVAGDGIRAFNYGNGEVEVNDYAGSITLQGQLVTGNTVLQNGYQAGINAVNEGPGNIDVMTAAGTSIDSHLAGSGIVALDKAPGVPAGAPINSNPLVIPVTSHISVVAHGTILSGTDLVGSGDVAAGILAGYNPNNSDLVDNDPNTGISNIHGTVFIDDFASITAAAGTDGIRGINYGDGTITIIAEAGAVISAGEYGIAAIGGDGGNITITNSATLTGGTAAIETTTATPTETVTIENLGHMTGNVLAENAAFDNGSGAEWDLAGASTFATGTNTLTNEGIIDSTGTSSITTGGTLSMTNTGTVNVQSGALDIGGPVAGTGQFTIGNGAQLELGGSVSAGQTITFDGSTGTLKLDDPTHFASQISGLTGSGGIDLAGFDSTQTVVNATIGTTQTVLTITDENHIAPISAAVITLLGNYTGSTFNFSSDAHGGVLIVDPPAGAPAINTIVATGPNQTLTGTGTPDNFVFNFANVGQATVTNFHADTDVLEVKASLFANLQAVLTATHDDADGNAIVALDSHDTITLAGVSKVLLNQIDFHLV
jgi:hypothetical protein